MKRVLISVCAIGAAVAIAGAAWATIPDGDGLISTCYDAREAKSNNGTALRVIDTESGATCKGANVALSFNQQGPPGPEGEQGAMGPMGDSGLSGYQIARSDSSLNSDVAKGASASCPVGTSALGGGASITYDGFGDRTVALEDSNPSSGGEAWVAFAREIVPTDQTWKLTVTAICATVAS